MNLTDYVKTKDFSLGLPQGDTIIELASTQVEETTFKGNDGVTKATYKLTTASGEVFTVPKTVMSEIKQLSGKGASKIRITRTGLQLNTRYTIVQV